MRVEPGRYYPAPSTRPRLSDALVLLLDLLAVELVGEGLRLRRGHRPELIFGPDVGEREGELEQGRSDDLVDGFDLNCSEDGVGELVDKRDCLSDDPLVGNVGLLPTV